MKSKILVLIALFLGYQNVVTAQKTRSTQQVCEALASHEVFTKFQKFHLQFEQLNTQVGNQLKYSEDYVTLNLAYNQVQNQYNAVLSMVKKDIANEQRLESAHLDPNFFIKNYQQAFGEVSKSYEQVFLPILNDVQKRLKKKPNFELPTLLTLSNDAAKQLAQILQSRKDAQTLSLNAALGTAHQLFYQKLRMKDWLALDIAMPTNKRPAAAADAQNHPFSTQPLPVEVISEKTDPAQAVPHAEVEPPFFDKLEAWFEMHITNPQNVPTPVDFFYPSTRDVEIAPFYLENGKLVSKKKVLQVAELGSEMRVSANLNFQIKTFNTAGMYIFTLTPAGKVQWLYPFDHKNWAKCAPTLGTGRELDDSPATFVVGRNTDGLTTVPAPNCSSQLPTEQFLSFSTARPEDGFEKLGVLFTRSEINMEQVARQLETARGDLAERLAFVFQEKLVNPLSANLEMEEGRIRFSHGNSERSILPFVLIFKRL